MQYLVECDYTLFFLIIHKNEQQVFFFFCLNSFSKFEDIFDEEYFTETLKNHVRVVKELPPEILQRFDNNISNILNLRSKALSSKTYYLQKVLPKLLELGYELVLQIHLILYIFFVLCYFVIS